MCSQKPDCPDDSVSPATSQVTATFSHGPCTPGLEDLTGLCPCSSLLLSAHSPLPSLTAPALGLLSSGYIIHHPLLLLSSAGSRTCLVISWWMYLSVYSLILNTVPLAILVNFNTHVDYPSKLAGFVRTWASPPKTRPPPLKPLTLTATAWGLVSTRKCNPPDPLCHQGYSLAAPPSFSLSLVPHF